MRESHRLMLFWAVARLVFGVVFLASVMTHWRIAWYYPLGHRWELMSQAQGIAIDWYGRSGLSLVAGLACGLAAWLLAGIPPVGRVVARRRVVANVAHLGALILASDVVFFVLSLLTRSVIAPPLPGWYCPQ